MRMNASAKTSTIQLTAIHKIQFEFNMNLLVCEFHFNYVSWKRWWNKCKAKHRNSAFIHPCESNAPYRHLSVRIASNVSVDLQVGWFACITCCCWFRRLALTNYAAFRQIEASTYTLRLANDVNRKGEILLNSTNTEATHIEIVMKLSLVDAKKWRMQIFLYKLIYGIIL